MLYGHGDDGYRFQTEIKADFSTNIYYGGEPKELKEHIFRNWSKINRYPEVVAESLSKKIAEFHQVDSSQILVTNGTTESIYLIAQSFRKSSATIVIPTFSEYEDACKLNEIQVNFIDWKMLDEDLEINSSVCFLCNPNNPTGTFFFGLDKLIQTNPNTLFIIDEAFIDFTIGKNSIGSLHHQLKNLVVLKSLTKTYAIPGLRLGYIWGREGLIKKIKSFKPPWSVNVLALEAGSFIFNQYEDFKLPVPSLFKDKESFIQSLETLPFIRIAKSDTHFFLLELLIGTSKELKDYLVNEFGILIRDASNFRGLSDRHIRVATLTPEKNQLLIEALLEWTDLYL